MFKQKDLQIIIQCNLKVVDFLVTYRSPEKPTHKTHFIHIQSDHPPSVTKQLPWSIEKRLSQLSSSKDTLYEMTLYYDQRLANCGYQQQGENNKNIKKSENAILYSLTTLQQITEDKYW